jgi:two-component system sensor histidine kinase FlrB
MNGQGQIAVALSELAGVAMVEMRDTGPGIPVELREKVLEPFFTTKARGGGLGLPIARRTAELHGGELTLMCPADAGTVVTLKLPSRPPVTHLAEANASPARTSQSDSAPDPG